MKFKLLGSSASSFDEQLQWIFYAGTSRCFVIGDERRAATLSVAVPTVPQPTAGDRLVLPERHPCNLPIPAALYEELSAEPWHGFRFLDLAPYDRAVGADGLPVGDLLRTLVFGPDYGHYLLHPASGAILGLRSRSLELLRRGPGGFEGLARTKARGRAALAIAAHPSQSLIAYGDNDGDFHAQAFDAKGFGKATKIGTKGRKASRLEFVAEGQRLMIGGMGYLASLACEDGKFTPLHEISIAVRDFSLLAGGEIVLVNLGLHGIAAYRHGADGFAEVGSVKPEGAVRQICVSTCSRYLAVIAQDPNCISIYEISPT